MNLFRSILMIAAGAFLIYRGWQIQTHPINQHWPLWSFYVVGVLAVVLGVWRLMRKPPKRLV